MAASASQSNLAEVLDFLFAANIEPTDAFACAKSLMEAGVSSRESISQLTPEKAKVLAPKRLHRKLLGALRRMPSLEAPVASPSAKKRKLEPIAPAPPERMGGTVDEIVVNRSPVMILWSACNAMRLDYDWSTALSLGSACAGLFARAKGTSLGLYRAASNPRSAATEEEVALMGKEVPVVRSAHGIRALCLRSRGSTEEWELVEPAGVYRSLASVFGDSFGDLVYEFTALLQTIPQDQLRLHRNAFAYDLYTRFRPSVPDGVRGWGQPGLLRITTVRALCHQPDGSQTSSHGRAQPGVKRDAPQSCGAQQDEVATASGKGMLREEGAQHDEGALPAARLKLEQSAAVDCSASATSGLHSGGLSASVVSEAIASASSVDASAGASRGMIVAALARVGYDVADGKHLTATLEELQLDGLIYERDACFHFI